MGALTKILGILFEVTIFGVNFNVEWRIYDFILKNIYIYKIVMKGNDLGGYCSK